MPHFSALNDYVADLPADRQQAIINNQDIVSLLSCQTQKQTAKAD